MPPKKRDKEAESVKNPRVEQIQADHESFLQAFEKPTQIYRYLRGRNLESPIFLYRTLSYMKQRMTRNNKKRRGFKVNCLLERLSMKNQEIQLGSNSCPTYMTLTFLGFFDKKVDLPLDPVKVETLLLKVCHKKRKDVSSPIMKLSMGMSEVPINPSEDHPPPKLPSVSISSESFSMTNVSLVKSYVLLLRVSYSSGITAALTTLNNDIDSDPPQKRRKSGGLLRSESKLYGSELIVYDKHNRCLLTDGEYELVLQELSPNSKKGSPKKLSSWESLGDIKEECEPFDVFSKGPTLKFRLAWKNEPTGNLVDRPKPIKQLNLDIPLSIPPDNKENNQPKDRNGIKRLQIVYQFLYNNNSRQQTEACEDLHCPWCSLDCDNLYSLLKHLKLCHARFSFTYVPIPQGARIDVAINEGYDGSYTGSPHDLISQPSGYAFSRNGPVRRTEVSSVLVCRPKRIRPSLSEFLELEDAEFDSQRPYMIGHNRLYHHTTTCLPIYPKELSVDSEGEHDPRWLQTKTMMMIDEFTDVNEGEKELMKMWNLHVMKYGYVGDCQIPLACTMFLEAKGKELLMKNLYRNFVLHMCSLFDFGLVSPVTVYTTIQKLQEMIHEHSSEVRPILQESWQTQKNQWQSQGCMNPEGIHFHQPSSTSTTNTTNTITSSLSNNSINNNINNNIPSTSNSTSNVRRKLTNGGITGNSTSESSRRGKNLPTGSSSSTTSITQRKSINENTLKRKSVNSGDIPAIRRKSTQNCNTPPPPSNTNHDDISI